MSLKLVRNPKNGLPILADENGVILDAQISVRVEVDRDHPVVTVTFAVGENFVIPELETLGRMPGVKAGE